MQFCGRLFLLRLESFSSCPPLGCVVNRLRRKLLARLELVSMSYIGGTPHNL